MNLSVKGVALLGAGGLLTLMFLNLSGWALYNIIYTSIQDLLVQYGFTSQFSRNLVIVLLGLLGAILLGGVGLSKGIKEVID